MVGDEDAAVEEERTCAFTRDTAICRAKPVREFGSCLAHLDANELEAALATFAPGAPVDLSAMEISPALLVRVLDSLRDPSGRAVLGDALFEEAHFTGPMTFENVVFSGAALFEGALFGGEATFATCIFDKGAWFANARFAGGAVFSEAPADEFGWVFDGAPSGDRPFAFARAEGSKAVFNGWVGFGGSVFEGVAQFGGIRFEDVRFNDVIFRGDVGFAATAFTGEADFTRAVFEKVAYFAATEFRHGASFRQAEFHGSACFDRSLFCHHGEFGRSLFVNTAGFEGTHCATVMRFAGAHFVACGKFGPIFSRLLLSFDSAVFDERTVIEVAARQVSCTDTIWRQGLDLRARYCCLDLTRSSFGDRSTVIGHLSPFETTLGELSDFDDREDAEFARALAGRGTRSGDTWMPVIYSVKGAEVSKLSLVDVDLSRCHFAGAPLLDEIRFEGRVLFDCPPRGVDIGRQPLRIRRWTPRNTIAEERDWRESAGYQGWSTDTSPRVVEPVGPERLTVLYRQLRAALEANRNEPGSADFYYGEMEMRRRSATTLTSDRVLLTGYWLVSGYGIRALRSLICLAIASCAACVALVGWGLAASAPGQQFKATQTNPASGSASFEGTIEAGPKVLPPHDQRWTVDRFTASTSAVVDSVVFRTTDQPLTSAGQRISDVMRIVGTLLLASTILAIRNRVKR